MNSSPPRLPRLGGHRSSPPRKPTPAATTPSGPSSLYPSARIEPARASNSPERPYIDVGYDDDVPLAQPPVHLLASLRGTPPSSPHQQARSPPRSGRPSSSPSLSPSRQTWRSHRGRSRSRARCCKGWADRSAPRLRHARRQRLLHVAMNNGAMTTTRQRVVTLWMWGSQHRLTSYPACRRCCRQPRPSPPPPQRHRSSHSPMCQRARLAWQARWQRTRRAPFCATRVKNVARRRLARDPAGSALLTCLRCAIATAATAAISLTASAVRVLVWRRTTRTTSTTSQSRCCAMKRRHRRCPSATRRSRP